MIPGEFVVPYLTANAIGLALLAGAFWRPAAVRWIASGIFVWAAATNTWTALADPQAYLGYAVLTPSNAYRAFIEGWFSDHVRAMVLPIAFGQATIAALLASRRAIARRLGVCGGVVFLLAIAPLGVGAGFPFSLTFGGALIRAGVDRVAAINPPPVRRIAPRAVRRIGPIW